MKPWIDIACLGCVVLISGCNSDAARRTAFETLQNVRQRECLKNPSSDCGKRENYEDYQRKREGLDPAN